jgi:glycosyltransferase involved in cell wall biosynthesis
MERLVSVGLPVRNGERLLAEAARSVLDQDYSHLELVISDNASDDGTEEICRELASADGRVRYHRHARDIGLVPNFNSVLHRASGTYFKWMGDDDRLVPTYISRCTEVLDHDPELILVTTQQAHVRPDGTVESASYDGTRLRSARPVERFVELLRLLNESRLLLDPLYGMVRRAPVARVPRPIMLFEDQVFAARLALDGPFGHLGEVLSDRRIKPPTRLADIARRLGVPSWQASAATTLQCRELLAAVREADLSPGDRRQAHAAVARLFLRRQGLTVAHRSRKLVRLVPQALTRPAGPHESESHESGSHDAPDDEPVQRTVRTEAWVGPSRLRGERPASAPARDATDQSGERAIGHGAAAPVTYREAGR